MNSLVSLVVNPSRSRAVASAVAGFVLVCLLSGLNNRSAIAEMKKSEKAQVARLKLLIDASAKSYKSGDFAQSGVKLKQAQRSMEKLMADASADLLAGLAPQYNRLKKAHELLDAKGITLPELKDLPTSGSDDASSDRDEAEDDEQEEEDRPEVRRATRTGTPAPVQREPAAREARAEPADSQRQTAVFSKDIAPILVANCSGCHIRQTKGELSIASYSTLMTGGESGEVIVPGDASASLLLELVSDKKMPPRKGLSAKDSQLIREWIDGGAKFDGPDEAAELMSMVPPELRRSATGPESEVGEAPRSPRSAG